MAGVTLPAAEWRALPGLDALVAALDGGAGQCRYVGGIVRDTLLGIHGADIDLATRLLPDEVMARLADAGIKAVPTGIAHGTVTAVSAGTVVEVTTLRRDVSTDGRHAIVEFTGGWREDAARRDFTINALFADPATGEVFDYFGGLEDLAARRVRFIGDPLQRIAEDHLRILRFFRFHARFGDAIDAQGLDACTERANDLMALSRERIRDELLKLLVAAHAVPVLSLMLERGVLRPVLPEIADAAPLARLALRETVAGVPADVIRRLAALLPVGSVEEVGARLKLSNLQRKRLADAAQPAGSEPARVLAYRLGPQSAVDRLLLSERDPREATAIAAELPPRLPLTGGALVARGVRKGPDVARLLREVEEGWIAEGFPDGPRVEALADQAVGQWLRSTSNA